MPKPLRFIHSFVIISAAFLFGLVYGLICPAVQPSLTSAESASTKVVASIDDIIAISAPTSASITITPKADSSTFATTSVDVSVTTNNAYGYQLTMGTSGTDSSGSLTTSLIENTINTSTNTISIPSITTSISDITTSNYDNFTDNSWGFTTNNNGTDTSTGQIVENTYELLTTTTNPTLIKSTDSTATADTTTVTFAVKINDEQPAGTYTNTVTFSAVANIVPQDDLLFWGSTDNSVNTATTLVDKSGNGNDGTLYNFDDTTSSGWNDSELIFDGVDDYVNIGLANYDFDNSISYVAYTKMLTVDSSEHAIINNIEQAGFSLALRGNDAFFIAKGFSESEQAYVAATSTITSDTSTYYVLIATYDGATIKLYVDGTLAASAATDTVTNSDQPICLGTNPGGGVGNIEFANMSLREALVYDRALTESEVQALTTIFQKKWQ